MAEEAKWKPGTPLNLVYEGYVLRSLRGDDIDERFISLVHDDQVIQHVAIPKRVTREQMADYVESHDNRTSYFFGIFPQGSEECIGYYRVAINPFRIGTGSVVIFNKEYWRRGVLRKCAYMVRKFLFAVMRVHKMEYRIYADNEAMVAYFKRSPYTLEGTLRESEPDDHGSRRDVLVFGLLRSEWRDDPPG